MFGIEYLVSIIKVLVVMGASIIWAIPVNFIWQKIGNVYFDFLPGVWLNIPYWHIVGLSILLSFIGANISKVVPAISKTTINKESKDD